MNSQKAIKQKSINGVKWTSIATVSIALAQLLKVAILTRFLTKSDFGLVAIIMFILAFTSLFTSMGLSSSILHFQNIKKNEYSSIYWLNLLFSLIVYFLIIFISPYVAEFYDEERLREFIPIMGIIVVISAIGRQFTIIEQKHFNFRTISLIEFGSSFVSLISASFLAVFNYGIYALIYSAILQHLFANFFFLVIGYRRNKIQLHFSLKETKPFLRIGIYQVGGQVVNYFNRDVDLLIIGKFFGSEVLGGYSLAKQLVSRPSQIVNPIINKVSAPMLANIQRSTIDLKRYYLKVMNIVSTFNFTIYILVIIFAEPIVRVLYGDRYLDIVVFVQILSIYMYFRAIVNPVGSLLIATGRTDLDFYWNIISAIIIPIGVLMASFVSVKLVAWTITIISLSLIIPAWYIMIRRLTESTLSEYIRSIVPRFRLIYKISISALNKK